MASLWSPLLRAFPDVRLLLKYKNLYDDRSVQDRIRREFAAHVNQPRPLEVQLNEMTKSER